MHKRIFYIGLIISCVVHLILGILFSLRPVQKLQKPAKSIEVTYQNLKPKKQIPKIKEVKKIEVVKKKPAPPKIKLLEKDFESSSPITQKIRDVSKTPEPISLGRKEAPKIKTLDISHKVTIPMLKSEKMTNPQFLSYYQTVRRLIREQINQYRGSEDFETGEVYLTFILTSEGQLVKVQVIERKTKASDYLKNLGLKSVRDASPFPPFPKELQYDELTINVIISFNLKG